MTAGQSLALAAASCLTGAALSFSFNLLRERYRFRQELKLNSNIRIDGEDWYAAWQTSVGGAEILCTEHLAVKQKGGRVQMSNRERAPENSVGGYLWHAQLQFFHGRDLMGWYFPDPKENNASKGIMFLNYNSSRKIFLGRWAGAAYDGPLSNGFVAISRQRQQSVSILQQLIAAHPCGVNVVSTVI